MCVCVCVYAHKLLGNAEKRRHPMVGGKDTAEVSRALDLCAKLLQSSLTLCNPMDYSPLGSSVHGDSPGKNTGVGSMPSSRGSSHIPYISSVAQLCPILCDPMDCSIQCFLVHHQLPELAQTHVYQVSDAIQPSHPLSFPSPPAFNLSQHQGLLQCISCLHQVAKILELQHQSFQWIFRTDFL